MRDSGGHSGNSYAETHIPLLMIGCDCESNRELFYKQIDFASTFSILKGLPIPSSSIGSIIPEMLFNMTQLEKLEKLKIVNRRLMQMIKSDGTEEFKFQLEKAISFHEMYEKDPNNKNAFEQAERNYLRSCNEISNRLSQRSLDVNIFQVLLGLSFNILIAVTIMMPCDDLIKDVRATALSFVPFIVGGFLLKFLVFNEIFQQSNNIASFLIMAIMSLMLKVVLEILNSKLERFKWFTLFDHDVLYLLMLGHFFYIISVCSSSFVEEEHQIWYYLCNTMFAFFTFFEFRGRTGAKSFCNATIACIAFLMLHVFIRRLNQTGDKYINVPDLDDWLHRDGNQNWLHVLIVLSLMASTAWLTIIHCDKPMMIPFILIGSVLLYFHHTRSINNR